MAFQSQLTPTETPAETEPQPPVGSDAPNAGTPLPDGDEEWQSSEPEPVAASTPPSSPTASQGAKGWDDPEFHHSSGVSR